MTASASTRSDAPKHTRAEQKVLKRITPPAKLPAIVGQTLKQAQNALKAEQLLANVHLGGSTAKGTYLKGDHDVDVFVRFSTKYEDKELADLLERALAKAFGKKAIERVHGSRDYFHVQRGSFTFEFIPVLNIASWDEARNVTDMSPLHVAYVAEHTTERPWLAGEIRLTKQFCKAARVYGAESYIGGFSGHVIDLLNIHYGGFRKLLEAAAQWPVKVVIDPRQQLDNPLTQLNDAKVYAPLVIVDPVQRDRNSAAALSDAAFKRFRAKAKEYLAATESEQEGFFTITRTSAKELAAAHLGAQVITLTVVPQRGKKDVVGAKCFKVFQHCVQQLLEHGFSLLESRWEFTPQKAELFFVLPPERLPAQEEIAGPPSHMTLAVAAFRKAHETTFTREGRVFAAEPRKYRDAEKLLAALAVGPYVRERVKSARVSVLVSKRRKPDGKPSSAKRSKKH